MEPLLSVPLFTVFCMLTTEQMLHNIKLILEYDGTNYHGWQSQAGSGSPTIQETLEQVLAHFTKSNIKTYSSGRTDAGVHAFGHVVNFKTAMSIPPDAWAHALNHLLPPDIRVVSSEEVAMDFHARYNATGKIYNYLVLNRPAPSSLYRNYTWQVSRQLSTRSMRAAASYLLGRHDFSAFRGSGCNAKTATRDLRSLVIKKSGDLIEIRLEADAFLQYMARNIVGTLVEAGLGRFRPRDVKQMLASCDRRLSGRTAPPQGLYLVQVHYPPK